MLFSLKRQSLLLLLLCCGSLLTACGPGHLGSNVIAFLRAGHLWTIDPDGANAFEVAPSDTPVIGYSWSPTHQLLAFRTLDVDFAKTPAGKQLVSQPSHIVSKDAASTLNTIGVDGGTPIALAFSSPQLHYSNALWNNNGSRLLYRTDQQAQADNALNASWSVSQNDQPDGIALKALPASYSIPALSYNSQHFLALGNNEQGVFTTTLAGTQQRYIMHGLLTGHPLPAALERVLWRPAHQDQSYLYSLISPEQTDTGHGALSVQLMLGTLTGQTTPLATCTCKQFAWSPDGQTLLYTTGTTYTLLNMQHNTTWNITAEDASVPYWSPDSQFLLLDGAHSLQLLRPAGQQQTQLLSDQSSAQTTIASLAGPGELLQPVPNSLWAADSRHFIVQTYNRLTWSGQQLKAGKGLYTASIDDQGHPQGLPAIVDTGNDIQAGWTYQDANTSFLY